jgi:class 3 adenylate cyclase
MAGLVIHAVVYVAVNAMFVAIWALSGGSADSFWPIWLIVTWGTALVIHAGAVVGPELVSRRSPGPAGVDRSTSQAPVVAVSKTVGSGAHGHPGAPGRRWVAVMFTDIVGSTGLNEALGDAEWHRLLASHRSLVRRAVTERGGSEVGTAGDGALARFDLPTSAVLCAIDIQRTIEDQREDHSFVPQVRIGIHAGETVEDDGDLVGRVVNLASRVASEAGAGEILVTEPVADQLVPSVEVEDRGLRPLKGLPQPRHLLAIRWSAEATRPPTG